MCGIGGKLVQQLGKGIGAAYNRNIISVKQQGAQGVAGNRVFIMDGNRYHRIYSEVDVTNQRKYKMSEIDLLCFQKKLYPLDFLFQKHVPAKKNLP